MTERIAILSAARTPVGKYLGGLSSLTAPRLGAVAVRAAVERAKATGLEVEEVVMGNVLQAGVGQNPARQAAIFSGLPSSTDAYTVNKVCSSGLQAIMSASNELLLGQKSLIVAGGMESMSNAPFLDYNKRAKKPVSENDLVDSLVKDGLWDCYNHEHMGSLAELLGQKFGISRVAQDEFALSSHRRAVNAIRNGYFEKEIVPVEAVTVDGSKSRVSRDEGPREDTSLEKLSALKAVFKPDGTVTAGNSSSLNDGAAALVLATEAHADELGLRPLGFIEGFEGVAVDPQYYGLGPVECVKRLCARKKVKVSDFDLVEVNEAFAVQALAVVKELGLDLERLNVNGGAIALGHPIGCSGARVLVTVLHELHRRKKDLGLATLCNGGGGATAAIVRRS